MAEDETDTLEDRVSVLFVRPGGSRPSGARIEALEVDDYGTVVDWPSDFLPNRAGEAEAVLRAGVDQETGTLTCGGPSFDAALVSYDEAAFLDAR